MTEHGPASGRQAVQGRVCACLVDGEPTLKRVTVEDRGERRIVILRGDNPSIEPMLVDETQELRIEGVAICLVSRSL